MMINAVHSVTTGPVRSGAGVGFVILLSITAPVQAEDSNQNLPLEVSGSIALVSDYRFRGISYSGGDAAVQAEITAAHESGFYVGAWSSSLDSDGSGFGSVEIDFYTGWSGNIASSISSDFNVVYYHYPNASSDPEIATDSFEANFSLSLDGDVVQPTVGISYAWGQNALEGQSNEARASYRRFSSDRLMRIESFPW